MRNSVAGFPPDRPLPSTVRLVEVGLRDGLQSVKTVLPTERKLELARALMAAGVTNIQVASFVHPAKVPQMADADAVSAAVLELAEQHPEVRFSGLALNRKGVERLAAAGLNAVDLSLSASEPHSRRNAGMGVAEAREHITASIGAARELGLSVRGGVQCVFGSFPGEEVPLTRVAELARNLLNAGATELALADSAGLADPASLASAVMHVREEVGEVPLTLHLHDTRGLGMANMLTALRLGVNSFDTAFGGLGGCPFIKGAAGNLATEDAVHLLGALGIRSGVDLQGVAHATRLAEEWLGVSMPSRVYHVVRSADHHAATTPRVPEPESGARNPAVAPEFEEESRATDSL